MTKADIVQRLLDKKEITAEEAVVLLSLNELKLEKTYPNIYNLNPWFGLYPPSVNNPYTVTATKPYINQINNKDE
jgi:hypothetical protein